MNNEIEVNFRKNSAKPKKRAKALNDYIIYLMDNEHILEADYYHGKLLELRPESEKSIVLGYKIAIRMFNIDRVVYFDKKIIEINANEELIMSLKLEYCCSINSKQNMESCVEWFLDRENTSIEYIEILIEAILILQKYEFISRLLKHMKKKKLGPSRNTERTLKKISVEKLAKTLHEVSRDCV